MSKTTHPTIFIGELHNHPDGVDTVINLIPTAVRLGWTFFLERPENENTEKTEIAHLKGASANKEAVATYQADYPQLYPHLSKIYQQSDVLDLSTLKDHKAKPNNPININEALLLFEAAAKYTRSSEIVMQLYGIVEQESMLNDSYARAGKILELLGCIKKYGIPYANIDAVLTSEEKDTAQRNPSCMDQKRNLFMAQKIATANTPCIVLMGAAHIEGIRRNLIEHHSYAPDSILPFIVAGSGPSRILHIDQDYSSIGVKATFDCSPGKRTSQEAALSILNHISHYRVRDISLFEGRGDYTQENPPIAHQLSTLTGAPFKVYKVNDQRQDAALTLGGMAPQDILKIQECLASSLIPYVFVLERQYLVVRGYNHEYVRNKMKDAHQRLGKAESTPDIIAPLTNDELPHAAAIPEITTPSSDVNPQTEIRKRKQFAESTNDESLHTTAVRNRCCPSVCHIL